ncbi:MAG: type II toxin-antitoxin system death-on-curing family toxin [Planctomycetota bacterium]
MTDPDWILAEAVEAIHHRQLAEHGGMEGVRDRGMLSSALARPRHLYGYAADKADIPALAAAYAFGIARNHPFVDGNKRTAAVVCEAFIELNGYKLGATDDELYRVILHLAEGQLSEDELTDWLRNHVQPA